MADRPATPSVEWRTVTVAAAVYSLWLGAIALHPVTPWPVTVLALGFASAWHGSLQHEAIHGHPFRSQRLNSAVAWLPVSLFLPYPVYRRYHIAHHGSDLTNPIDDSESFYVAARQWNGAGRLRRSVLIAHHTMLGRLVLGPARWMAQVVVHQWRVIWRGDRELARWWAAHVVMATALGVFVVTVVGLPLWQYFLGATYLGSSLTLMRSFCEHRWVQGDQARSAMVRSGRFFSLLYLNNNLHHAHHVEPSVSWYDLPEYARSSGAYEQAEAGAGVYRGYLEVAGRFGVRPFDHPVHPEERELVAA